MRNIQLATRNLEYFQNPFPIPTYDVLLVGVRTERRTFLHGSRDVDHEVGLLL